MDGDPDVAQEPEDYLTGYDEDPDDYYHLMDQDYQNQVCSQLPVYFQPDILSKFEFKFQLSEQNYNDLEDYEDEDLF